VADRQPSGFQWRHSQAALLIKQEERAIMSKVSIGRLSNIEGLFSSESVSDGHPDKICDQISDAVLDQVLAQDPYARVAVETAVKDNAFWVFGEISGTLSIDVEKAVRGVLSNIGHEGGRWGLDLDRLDIRTQIGQQANEIAAGVNQRADIGAGDQGMMFGFATIETPELMPAPISLAHRLLQAQKAHRQKSSALGPDAKAQVSVRYVDGKPTDIHTIVLSSQHDPELSLEQVREILREEIVRPALGDTADKAILYLNPAGRFTQGGPIADAGLTGRKIIVDTYGGFARHGGGAFSGKDGTKVDRSAAYAARQLALSLVKGGLADAVETRIAYSIGEAEPVAVHIDFRSNGPDLPALRSEQQLLDLLKPRSIIDRLQLRLPRFSPTASGGHFGRAEFAWEHPIEGVLLGFDTGQHSRAA
jgi:S-adenosylmethionine synthetase